MDNVCNKKAPEKVANKKREPELELTAELLAALSFYSKKGPQEIDEFSREVRQAIDECRQGRKGNNSTQYGTLSIK